MGHGAFDPRSQKALQSRNVKIDCMFARRISIERVDGAGASHPCPIKWIDNFAMRNFTNDPVFDDTLPVADGLLEAGNRVPLARLQQSMEDWFRRKGYLTPTDHLKVEELGKP
jgi:hypothetical protein